MLNKKETYTLHIIDEFRNRIYPSWHRRLQKNVLRGLGATLLRIKSVSEKESIEFYNKCCQQEVYPLYDVNNKLNYYLYKLINLKFVYFFRVQNQKSQSPQI